MSNNLKEIPLSLPYEITIPRPLMYPIVDWGLLEVRGPDAEKFLQGQVTCDVRQLLEKGYLDGAFCNPKGRVLATFRLISTGNTICLRMPTDLISHIQTVLQKYAAFFDVQLHHKHETRGLFLESNAPIDVIQDDPLFASVIKESSAEFWGSKEQIETMQRKYQNQYSPAAADWWRFMLIKTQTAQIFEATREQFLAHQLSLDLTGAISFRKGCYTGQEIIARTQYRGKSKKRLASLRLEGSQYLAPGTEIFSLEKKPLGHVLLGVSDSQSTLLQAVLPEDVAKSGRVILGSENTAYEIAFGPMSEKQ